MFVACGTSYHSCLAARSLVEEMVEVPVVLELASDLLDRHAPVFRVGVVFDDTSTLKLRHYPGPVACNVLCIMLCSPHGARLRKPLVCAAHAPP